jgi:glycosyltransferase involved in cell wall biosynthesis
MNVSINLCSIGNPADPTTWSGTPFNLFTEFTKMNAVSDVFASDTMSSFQRYYVKTISKLRYGNSIDKHRGIYHRSSCANRVKKCTDQSNSPYTLHFGTNDLPFPSYPEGQYHFLYCDTTWNLWSTNSTNIKLYTKRLLKDIEILERKAYSQITHFFPIGEYVKENLTSYYGIPEEKITPVGTGMGIIKPYFGPKDYSNKKILFTAKGRFNDKGGPLVVDAFKKAVQKDKDLQLTIVGQHEYKEKIKHPNITTYGFLPLEELQEIFNTHSLFIMPALNEPWGLVYIEALLCRMPVIGLNRNSIPEITDNEKYGILLNDSNPDHLADLFIQLFKEPRKLEEMGTKGQQFVAEKYTWEKTAKKILKTINTYHYYEVYYNYKHF